MRIPEWPISSIAGSIFKASAPRARKTLASDAFIIFMAYLDCPDFDLHLEEEFENYDIADLYRKAGELSEEICAIINERPRTSHFNKNTDNQLAAKIIKALNASDIIVSPFILDDLGYGYACWVWRDDRCGGEDDVFKANLVAEQIALSFKVSMKEKRSKEQSDRLAALLELSNAVYSSLDYQEVLQKAVKLSTEIMEADGGSIFALNKAEMIIRPLIVIDDYFEEPIRALRLKLGEGIVGKVVQSGIGVISNDSENDPRAVHVPGTPVTHDSVICAPLMLADDVFGAISLWNHTGTHFDQEDLEILSIFARQIAFAMENARLFANLQKANKEMTTAQEKLIMGEKLKALGEMAGGVAHDFNNVLGTILGRAQLLLRKIEDPLWKKELEKIEEVALDGRRTIQRLQDFTHVSSHSQFGAVSLNEIVEKAIDSTRPAWKDIAQRQSITINLRTELARLPLIDGDFDELKEAIVNIIINAVDALQHGGNILIKTYNEDEKACLCITDDGIGMDETTKNRLFFPFFSTKPKKGSGMGLAIVYGILFRHQADISVASSLGNGASFIFKFNPTKKTIQEITSPTKPSESKGLSILLVDDDVNLLDVVFDMLTLLEHQVTKVDSGRGAIELLKKNKFDLVVTDLGMPEIAGWDVARFAKETYRDIPVILVSGWGAQLDRAEALQKVDAVLAKPFGLDEIDETINKVMESRMPKLPV